MSGIINPTENAREIINYVKEALKTYGSDNVCVDIDVEDDQIIVAYHSDKDGFPITETGISPDDVNRMYLRDELYLLDVAYDGDL